MKINFKDISYLKNGNEKQKKVFRIITQHQILEKLQNYNPILVGTIPINIDIEESDIDIILQTDNFVNLIDLLNKNFSNYDNYKIELIESEVLLCNFDIDSFPIELYAKNLPTDKQNGYLHMIKEYEILQSRDAIFIEKIKNLKRKGIKTEPAFCMLLQIDGNPYIELLNYNI